MNLLEYFDRDDGSSQGPPQARNDLTRALACLALIAFEHGVAQAQTLTPDLFRPVPDGFVSPQDMPLRRTSNNSSVDPTDNAIDPSYDERLRGKDTRAPSRIGQIPSYGLPAASGASDSGFNSLNRKRKKPKFYPGQAKPKPPPGPGSRPPGVEMPNCRCGCRSRRPKPPTRRRCRRRWRAPWSASRRASASRSTTIRSARSAIMPAAS